jgi:uncharacterized protein (TIGR02001 family)
MKPKILAVAALTFVAANVLAETAPAEPENTLAYNIGAVSEYRYRGLSQTNFKPALQGGADYTHTSGFYLGTWASTISWIKDAGSGASGPVELDLYGGYKFSISDLAMDVGYLRYQYVNNSYSKVTGVNANTDEVYAAGTYSVFTLKYSYAFSNLFGTVNSKGSSYTDLSANFDLGSGFTLTPHMGYQLVNHSAPLSYKDYALTLAKDLGDGWSATASAISVQGDKTQLVDQGKFTGKGTLVVGAKYTF